jgi:hypothetical protein
VVDRTLTHFCDLVRQRRYVVSSHATEELEDDELEILDLESIVLTGEIIERQIDRRTREQKYLIRGITLANALACVVAKVDAVGRAVFITVYRE